MPLHHSSNGGGIKMAENGHFFTRGKRLKKAVKCTKKITDYATEITVLSIIPVILLIEYSNFLKYIFILYFSV